MKEVDPSEWAHIPIKNEKTKVIKVFRSDKFLVQVRKHGDSTRLSINKINHTLNNGEPIWEDGITWDELQEIKNQCGFKGFWLCEYFPPENEVVNGANMRHLWVLKKEPMDSLACIDGFRQHADSD